MLQPTHNGHGNSWNVDRLSTIPFLKFAVLIRPSSPWSPIQVGRWTNLTYLGSHWQNRICPSADCKPKSEHKVEPFEKLTSPWQKNNCYENITYMLLLYKSCSQKSYVNVYVKENLWSQVALCLFM